MQQASQNHRKIASNIRELVVSPFGRWCDQHSARVQNSQDDLQGRIKAHDRQAETVRQYRSAYFNKCRRVEDLDEEEKLAFQDPGSAAASGSPKPSIQSVPSIKVEEEEEDEPEPIDIGDETYQPEQVKKLLIHALNNIKLGEAKVPILGTYQNVSTGSDITEYIQRHMGANSVAYAERIGQDLIGNGFLRLVGNVGSTFANSSKMNYQWRPKTFQMTGVPEKKPKLLGRTSTTSSQSGSFSEGTVAFNDYLGGWNPLNNAHPNETPAEKLRREAKEADERYKAAIRKLDGLRCNLEEAIIDHLKFMERCELDRLKAIKSVILDFSGAVSNVIPSLQSTVDNMMLFQETVQPLSDLRYLLENYRTGNYVPKVTTYENYYNTVDEQTFGVDIEARARSDRKRVPIIVTTLLMFLDSHYPDLEGDEARRSIWLVDVPLAATHHLRNQLNTGKPIPPQLLEKYEIPIVAATLKLYLLELPDSLISSHVYEIVKTIYSSTAQTASESQRIQVIQSTLSQLRLANIATLDAIITHFSRLIELTSADEPYVSKLTNILAPILLRPKQESSLSMTEKYNARLVRDLLAHKDDIFGELKRASSLNSSNSTRSARAVSTDESKRREHMEERQRAIFAAQAQAGSSRSRDRSPAPGRIMGDGHLRDKSRGAETRFPISTNSVTSPTDNKRNITPNASGPGQRGSLEVPLSPPQIRNTASSSTRDSASSTSSSTSPSFARTNGSIHQPPPAENEETPPSDPTRSRSATETSNKRTSQPPTMSSSVDFMSSNDYYTESPTSTSNNASETAIPASAVPTSKYSRTSEDTPTPEHTPEKRDSLNRASAARKPFQQRKATGGGLQRQSLVGSVGNRDSISSETGSGGLKEQQQAPPQKEEGPKGVVLEDKPMDFD